MYYHFAMHRVDEMDWVVHMQNKTWMTKDRIEDFEEALSYARDLNKIREALSISNEPLKAFLCHGTEDKAAVRELYNKLVGFGVKPWLDEEDLVAGQDWRHEIQKAIKTTHVVIVCLSEKSVAKTGYVQKEIKYALDLADERPEGSIFIIPAKLEECSLPDRLARGNRISPTVATGPQSVKRGEKVATASLKQNPIEHESMDSASEGVS
jgi:TIR domain